jgi:predicted RNase H-like HicB family nuclease
MASSEAGVEWRLRIHERNQMEQYTAIFEDGDDGWIVASCPEVPGALTQGRSIDEARENLRDAVHEMLAALREDAERELEGREDVTREPLAL